MAIARLNIGGAAMQAIDLTARLPAHGWRTALVRGREGPREGSMDGLAVRLGVRPIMVTSLGRELDPLADLATLARMRRLLRRMRPEVLHTHTAKAGAVGRVAAALAGRHRPGLVVHTFHGHVLSGYFSPRRERIFVGVERLLARLTDVIVAVSAEVRDDLLAAGIGRPGQVRVIPLGLDLDALDLPPTARSDARRRMRRQLGVPAGAPLVTLVARLVPIKRVDLFLAAAEALANDRPEVRFCVAGDGELAERLRASPAADRLGARVAWPGFVHDTAALYAASDVVALTSDNEGTPVSLIEALASGTPVVATAVGGVPSVVRHGGTGLLAPAGDAAAIAAGLRRLVDDPALRARLAAAGRDDVRARFTLDRLVRDVAALYAEGLDRSPRRRAATPPPHRRPAPPPAAAGRGRP